MGSGITHEGMLTPVQLAAARALADWTREDLAKRSGTSLETVKGFEWGGSNPKMNTVMAWRRALQQAGVVFLDDDGEQGPGVRLKDSESKRRKK